MPLMDPTLAAARYEHGTIARYKIGKCRCADCREAIRVYEVARTAHLKKTWRMWNVGGRGIYVVKNVNTGEQVLRTENRAEAEAKCAQLNGKPKTKPNEFISARAARTHIANLRRAGMGRRVIERVANVSDSVMVRIASGEIKKIRRAESERILSVRLETTPPPGGARVNGEPTFRLLDEMLAAGFSKSEIGRRLGLARPIQFKRKSVTARNARKVKALHKELFPAARSAAEKLASALRAMDPDEFATRISRFRDVSPERAA